MDTKKSKKKKKKKFEFSKIFAGFIALFIGEYGVYCGMEYYALCRKAIENGTDAMPDATLAVTCVTVVFGTLISYAVYQFGLKNSRNKYKVDEDGNPMKEKLFEEDEE